MKITVKATALAFLTATALHAAPVVWKAGEVSGAVTVQSASRAPVAVRSGGTIPAGSTLRTGADGKVRLDPLPGVALKAGANTQLRGLDAELRKGGGRAVQLDFSSGALMGAVSKGSLRIDIHGGRLETNGAVFSTTLSPRCELLLVVASGSVEVIRPDGKRVKVRKGQFITGTVCNTGFIVSAPAAISGNPAASALLAGLDSFFEGDTDGQFSRTVVTGSSGSLETAANPANFSTGASGGSTPIRSGEQ